MNNQSQLQQIDRILTHQLKLNRVSADAKKKLLAKLKKVKSQVIGLLADNLGNTKSRKSQDALVKMIGLAVSEEYEQMEALMGALLYELTDHVIDETTDLLEVPAFEQAAKLTAAKSILILGAPSQAWWEKQSDALSFKFATVVRQSIADNLTVSQAVAKVKPFLHMEERGIRALVNTSMAAAANNARIKVFEANAGDNDIMQQISTLDGHTSKTCMAYSGAKWYVKTRKPIDGAPDFNNGIPRHVNCRSVIVRLTRFSHLPGERVSELGRVDRHITFDDFLKMKSKEDQDEMLGEGRADLWRAGKITLRDLVSQDGRPLSLKSLTKQKT